MKAKAIFTSLIISALVGCNGTTDKTPDPVVPVVPVVATPDFNADSAFVYISQQTEFGPRIPNSEAHLKCALFLEEKLRSYGAEVIVQQAGLKAYNGKILNARNIIAAFNPGVQKRILLCAHWDTRHIADQDALHLNKPFDGANDGASGVGVLIEVARMLSIVSPNVGVDIILFDAEDYGQPENSGYPEMKDSWCLGSQYWARNLHKPNYTASYGILLDMVGAKGATFKMEGTSMHFAPGIMEKVWKTASRIGYSDYFSFERTGPIIDDHLYVNRITGIPTIDIIHHDMGTRSGFFKHWHTTGDNMDVIDRNTLKAVGQTVMEVIFTEGRPLL
jgi:glutaminyl-peptide cyclotransferase